MVRKPKYRDDVTDPAQQQALMLSPELRAERQANHRAELPMPRPPLRGRRAGQIVGKELLALEFSRTLSAETVSALGAVIRGRQPLFNEFTDHNHINSNDPESIENFVTAGNKKNTRLKSAKTPEERKIILENMRRQTQEQADSLERGIFTDLSTAKLWRGSLHLVRAQIKAGVTLDKEAATRVGNAIEDFGRCLKHSPEIMREIGREDLAETLGYIGQTAYDDPSVLAENPHLLGLVHAEQVARCAYWQPRFDTVKTYFTNPVNGKDRLTQADIERGEWLQQELQRMQGLMPSEPAT